MTAEISDVEIQNKILSCLHKIVPEVDLQTLKKDQSLRDQVDIDSLDFTRLVVLFHEALGVDVPELDYPKLATLDSCLNYFKSKVRMRVPSFTKSPG